MALRNNEPSEQRTVTLINDIHIDYPKHKDMPTKYRYLYVLVS